MNWTRKDWIDLLLMVIGACLGVWFFGFVAAPLLGLEFIGGQPFNYMLAAATGTVSGYLLRFGVRLLSVGSHS